MKIVTDSNVFFRAILGRKAGTASKMVINLISEGKVTSYTCDALMGEIGSDLPPLILDRYSAYLCPVLSLQLN